MFTPSETQSINSKIKSGSQLITFIVVYLYSMIAINCGVRLQICNQKAQYNRGTEDA